MSYIGIVSYIAVILAPLSFISQIIKTWRLKETKDISLVTYVIFWTGVVLWLIYGLLIKNLPIVANNIIMLILTSMMLFFKFKYK